MGQKTRRIVLKRYIEGVPSPDDFEIVDHELPDLADGRFLVRNILLSVDPGTRARLSGQASYVPPLKLGEMVGAFSVGEVIESRHPDYVPGDIVSLAEGWAEHLVSKGRGFIRRITDRRLPLSPWLGVLGVSGMTAWFGLRRVGGLKSGQTVVVTSAAGAVGSAAGQIARLEGCRVIGVAGGLEKCRWLVDEAGFDHAIDYRSMDVAAAVAEAAPDGVDILFDNVGNEMIDAVIPSMNLNGVIVVSGQVAAYNQVDPPGLQNTRAFITHRLKMQGLVVFDDLPWDDAERAMAEHVLAGEIVWRDEIGEGLESIPEAFAGLFRGENRGRRLARLAPDPFEPEAKR
ncbi:NADP-dependent oxidoreductase [Minwuia thermotolerans]|uniref:NADP-dependent oxidoreductase n=1 Tax=Minwuia thermotolerans TaxID=2056226 RepID=A0A2M9FXF3_9PROT|nr:NADP-dependent oxidoreductase [Minwuia thermotolerans]PJK28130.1 NADP-dependent oxidoreductase [Minwuia thermotolerans]